MLSKDSTTGPRAGINYLRQINFKVIFLDRRNSILWKLFHSEQSIVQIKNNTHMLPSGEKYKATQ